MERVILTGADGVRYIFVSDVNKISRITRGYWVARGSRLWEQRATPQEISQIAAGMWDFGEYLKRNGPMWFLDETKSGNIALICRLDEVEEEENEFGLVSP